MCIRIEVFTTGRTPNIGGVETYTIIPTIHNTICTSSTNAIMTSKHMTNLVLHYSNTYICGNS